MPKSDYKNELTARFWEYRSKHFQEGADFFDGSTNTNRPPVFRRNDAWRNILLNHSLSDKLNRQVIEQMPIDKRHRWFGSMSSSQALAQSVFGNLKILNKLDCLAGIQGEDGKPLFVRNNMTAESIQLEFDVDYLGEPRRTNIDVLLGSDYKVAVECKLTETDIGTCSRPRIKPDDPRYASQYCNGRYEKQMSRAERCALTSLGIKYWEYIDSLFAWSAGVDHNPCPLSGTYQLVRNILAACVQKDGRLANDKGHAVLLYDARNSEFQAGGNGFRAWHEIKTSLLDSSLLKVCTWQQLTASMRTDPELLWLTDLLGDKYGF